MKKVALILFLVFIFCNPAMAEESHFRDVNWGMSVEDIKNCEKSVLKVENENDLTYISKIFDEECYIFYYFKDGKLTSAGYLFENLSELRSETIFLDISFNLNKKYAEVQSYGNILKELKNDNTVIQMARSRKQIIIMYNDIKYYNLKQQAMKAKREEDLSKF